jgi:hypothetical protein
MDGAPCTVSSPPSTTSTESPLATTANTACHDDSPVHKKKQCIGIRRSAPATTVATGRSSLGQAQQACFNGGERKRRTRKSPMAKRRPTIAGVANGIIMSHIFPFLDQAEHVRFARTNKRMLCAGGLLPPPRKMVPTPITWRHKLIRLPGIMADNELARWCTYARPTRLSLAGCTHLTDEGLVHLTSLLPFLTELDLWQCREVTDVSAFGGVTTLNLGHCTGVTDVSALGGVTSLDLRYCASVRGVSLWVASIPLTSATVRV